MVQFCLPLEGMAEHPQVGTRAHEVLGFSELRMGMPRGATSVRRQICPSSITPSEEVQLDAVQLIHC